MSDIGLTHIATARYEYGNEHDLLCDLCPHSDSPSSD